ncbi:putative permease [Bacteriovorax sp. BAL6_X]|uniref:SO_0444 family Cu/Zn efflux transporter n=1 Tax=Bacteriovorax sp. BAL6_X TaxID=1201290 RepID=UPI000386BEF0|nr:SO_0444 family Cu/Zn efflux transporter [Bacteriovorax sp. BAL6_X]EPZ49748.1 putative permease [Bacteriovorax sp. BAL6_X]
MSFLTSLWNYILVSAPFLMFGLLVAGIIKAFISVERIKKAMGGKGLMGAIKASLLGIPLPLCSCAVIPTAATLKKQGASNSATSAFLIATPESGVDSIAMTYGMMDIPMTVIRPVAAFVSAFVAGALQLVFKTDSDVVQMEAEVKASCCGSSNKKDESVIVKQSFGKKAKASFHFGFIELVDDMAIWLAFGIVAGALIDFALPANFFDGLSGWAGRGAILLVGIPLYICASATTPIAASLVMKGMSPGMALLFLLVGPATNISNILVIGQYIGKRGVVINLLSIALVALGFSFLTDYLYSAFSWPLNFNISHHNHDSSSWWEISLAVAFTMLLLRSLVFVELPKRIKKYFEDKGNSGSCCG